ncbi:MAG: hypothetical protein ABI728_11770 [Betaproteobacteria bacterium]
MIDAPILAYLIETTNGRMKFDGPDRVLDYGVEADFVEIWERLSGGQGESFAIRMPDDPPSPLPCAGACVMFVRLRSEFFGENAFFGIDLEPVNVEPVNVEHEREGK